MSAKGLTFKNHLDLQQKELRDAAMEVAAVRTNGYKKGIFYYRSDNNVPYVNVGDETTGDWRPMITLFGVLADVQPVGAANATGTSNNVARADHVHAHGNQAGGSLHALVVSGGDAGFMSGTDKSRVDTLWTNFSPYTVTNDGTFANPTDSKVVTQLAIKTYFDTRLTGVKKLIGGIDCSANPNYPAAAKGDTYVVTVAGKIGGAGGITVNIGDEIVCQADSAGGDQATAGADFFILESNRDQATETTLGVIRLATQAEVNAGTDDSRAVTPLKLKTFADAGYIRNQIAALQAASAAIDGKLLIGSLTFQGASSNKLGVKQTVGDWAVQFEGHTAAGNSFGLKIVAGTNASDAGLLVTNSSNNRNYLKVAGDGLVSVSDEIGFAKLHIAGKGANDGDIAAELRLGRTNGVAIKAFQSGADDDVQGLKIYVHPSQTGTDPEALAVTINPDKSAKFESAIEATIAKLTGIASGAVTDSVVVIDGTGLIKKLGSFTEEVQDAIGNAAFYQDTNTVNITYDDANNRLQADLNYQDSTTVNFSDSASGLKADVLYDSTTLEVNANGLNVKPGVFNKASFTATFNATTSWTQSGDQYYIDFTHGLANSNPGVTVWEDGTNDEVVHIRIIKQSATAVRIITDAGRFAGKITITP